MRQKSLTSPPLVSIVTPVHNGGAHFRECIESVLAQTYQNWEYIIVENCSSDDSLRVAARYAERDPRFRIVQTEKYLSIVPNHNFSVQQISPASKYMKMVFADDWLYPTCIEEMVRIGEQSPSIGIVGAYTIDGAEIRWRGPRWPRNMFSGREICRGRLLGGPNVFGTMTSVLIRSDLVRARQAFFDERVLESDLELCFSLLGECDFGFVHQVLSFSRDRDESSSSFASNLNSQRLTDYGMFLRYGPKFLSKTEFRSELRKAKRQYYQVLAHNLLRFRPKEFWEYHRSTLRAYGTHIEPMALTQAFVAELAFRLLRPIEAIRRGRAWWSGNRRRHDGEKVGNYMSMKSGEIRERVSTGSTL